MVDEKQLVKLYVALTPRQREVLQLVSSGLTNQEIGQRLYIASSVVAGHLTSIYETLAALEALEAALGRRPNRYILIGLYADFFRRHPELDNFIQ